MTTGETATVIYPQVKAFLQAMPSGLWKPLSRPFWFFFTRVAIEVGVVLARAKLQPILAYLIALVAVLPPSIDQKFLQDFFELVQTPVTDMLEEVSSVLESGPTPAPQPKSSVSILP